MLFVLFAIHLLIYLSVSLTNYDLIDGGSELLLFPGCSNLGWLHIVSYQSTWYWVNHMGLMIHEQQQEVKALTYFTQICTYLLIE